MTDLRKAAEMALETLERLDKWLALRYGNELTPPEREVVKALRQALAMERFSEVNQEIEEALKQPEQKPVAWILNRELFWHSEYQSIAEPNDRASPLYIAPPKREWVDLDEEEQKECWDDGGSQWAIYQNIASKLKEKNGG